VYLHCVLRLLQRTLGWRTCLIVPELEHEIRTHKDNAKLKVYINDLRALQYDLDEWADDLRYKVISPLTMNILTNIQFMCMCVRKRALWNFAC
jgi:5' nucleotidase family